MLLRPDHQDFQGTAVTVEVARKLGVRRLVLVLNKVLPIVAERGFPAEVERTYGAPGHRRAARVSRHAGIGQQRPLQPPVP